MKLLRAPINRLDSWARFSEFEHLDAMYDVRGDDDKGPVGMAEFLTDEERGL